MKPSSDIESPVATFPTTSSSFPRAGQRAGPCCKHPTVAVRIAEAGERVPALAPPLDGLVPLEGLFQGPGDDVLGYAVDVVRHRRAAGLVGAEGGHPLV